MVTRDSDPSCMGTLGLLGLFGFLGGVNLGFDDTVLCRVGRAVRDESTASGLSLGLSGLSGLLGSLVALRSSSCR